MITNHQSIRLSALPKDHLLTSTIVVVFGRATVMLSKGGASCIQHHREHPLTTEAIVSWLSNNGSMMPRLEVLRAPLQSGIMLQFSNVSLEQHWLFWNKEIFKFPGNFQKFQGNKLKSEGVNLNAESF